MVVLDSARSGEVGGEVKQQSSNKIEKVSYLYKEDCQLKGELPYFYILKHQVKIMF